MVFDLDAEKINPLMALSPPDCEPTLLSLRVKAPSVFTFNVRKARLTLPEISGNPAPLCAPATKLSPGAQFRKDLRLPQKPSSSRWLRRGQRFFRNWAQQGDAEAGAWEQDAIRNITGTAGSFKAIPGSNRFSGAFTKLVSTGGSDDSAATGPAALSFDASLVVHTGPQNVPQHVWQPLVIYLGRSSQV